MKNQRMNKANLDFSDNLNTKVEDDQIDLDYIFKLLLKYKKFILLLSSIGLLIGSLKALTTKPTWRGEFEIVIRDPNEKKGSLRSSAESLILSNLGGESKSLIKTEVAILKSPSVLMDIFDFVKKEKFKNGQNLFSNTRFQDWRNANLNAQLEKGTQVLKISYEDKDKKLIKPVLELISKKYQEYSGQNRMRNIELELKYFEEQINIFSKKSKISNSKAEKFGLEHAISANVRSSLGTLGSNKISTMTGLGNQIFTTNVEIQRIKSKNDIKLYEDQLSKIKLLDQNPSEILGMLFAIDGIDKSLGYELQKLNSKLAKMKVVYRKDDYLIQNLLDEKANLVDLIKEQIIGYFSARKESAKTLFESSKREEGILLTFKSLFSEAQKDAITLNGLENEYRILLLEKAKNEDPWQLITKPTLLPEPVEPKIFKSSIIGLLTAILISSGIVLFYINQKKFIFTNDKMMEFFNYENVANIDLNKKDDLDQTFYLLSKNMFSGLKEGVSLLYVGNINNEILDEIKSVFQKYFPNLKINLTNSFREALLLPNIILLSALGITTEEDAYFCNKKLKLNINSVDGLIILNSCK